MKKHEIAILIFLLLLFMNPEASAQKVTCEDPGCRGVCIELEFISMKDWGTPSEYEFPDLVSINDYLVINKITVSNNPEIDAGSEITSNLTLTIYVHPVGSEEPFIADLFIPRLNTSDVYEVIYLGGHKSYVYKLNDKVIERTQSPIYLQKLYDDVSWQIDVNLDGYDKWPVTIINGEIGNNKFKVYSKSEITGLETAEKNLWSSWVSLVVIIIIGAVTIGVGIATVYYQKRFAKKQEMILKEVIEELKKVVRNPNTSAEKQIEQKQEEASTKIRKRNSLGWIHRTGR